MARQEFYQPKKRSSRNNDEQLTDQKLDLAGNSGRLDSARSASQGAQGTLDDIDSVLADQEAGAAGSGAPTNGDAEQEEASNLDTATGLGDSNNDSNWDTNLDQDHPGQANKTKASLTRRVLKARKVWYGGGIAGMLISAIFAIFAFVSPYKGMHIINSIDGRAGGVVENALEHRLVYYMTRYLILRAAMKYDTSFTEERAYTYIGKGTFRTLYTNWKGAQLEAILERDYHIQLKPIRQIGSLTGRDLVKPSNWEVHYLDEIDRSTGKPRVERLDAPGARNAMKLFSHQETKDKEVNLSYLQRRTLKKYMGISNWKPFEKTQNKGRDFYLEKKAAFQKFMIRQTVGRMSSRWAAYMSCLIDGGDACKARNLNPPDETANLPDEDLENLVDGRGNEASDAISKKLQEIALKRMILASAAGLGILKLAGGIVNGVDTGALSRVAYESKSQQYGGFYSSARSAVDQVGSGDILNYDYEDAKILAEMFNGFESSPVYYSPTQAAATVSAASQYVRDCDGNGTKETTLDVGETVCPNKKVLEDKEGIKKMFFWPILSAVGTTVNTVLKPVDWMSEALNSALDSLGVSAMMTKALEITGIDKAAAPVLQAGITWAIGFGLTGLEVGEDAYDAVYAGMAAAESLSGSTLDGLRAGTIGGGYLSPRQLSEIKAENYQYEQYALSQKGIMERYFSPDVDTSITSYAIMHAPTDMTSLSMSFMSAINPVNVFSRVGALFTAPTHAAATNATMNNPFGVIYMGYANDHPALTMEEDDLNAKYRCDLPEEERPQNKKMGRPDGIPFDIYTEPDPCQLDKSVEAVGSKYFDGSFHDIDN